MSHSAHLPANIATLEPLGRHDRMCEMVSVTGKACDRISPETIFLSSILLGNDFWVYDDLYLFRSGFPKYKLDRTFQGLIHKEMNYALCSHFKTVLEEEYPGGRTITKQKKRVENFRKQMKWISRRQGYHGVIIAPDHVNTIEKTREFVCFFNERWRDDSLKTRNEKNYVSERFSLYTCLEWIFDPCYLERKLRKMEEKYGAL